MSTDAVPSGAQRSQWQVYGGLMGLFFILLVELIVTKADRLLHRDFWLDEIYTYTVVSDPDFSHAMRAISGGVETHPPTLFIILRLYTSVVGVSESSLRLFSLLSVAVGLSAVYLLLCQVCHPLVALIGSMALWCHPLQLEHAFEARFYGPLFAACAWYAFLLSRNDDNSRFALRLALAILASFICILHYFGVLSFILITIANLYFRRSSAGVCRYSFILLFIGIASTLATVPLALAQRGQFTVPSWISPVDATSGWDFLFSLLFEHYLVIFLFIPWFTYLQEFRWRSSAPSLHTFGDPNLLAGATSLLMLPIVLLVVSLVWQPVHVSRYALPALLGIAPCVAFMVAHSSRLFLIMALGFLIVVGIKNLRNNVDAAELRSEQTRQLIADIRNKTNGSLVVFRRPHRLYVVCKYAPDLTRQCVQLDFEFEQMPEAGNFHIFVRDLSRRFAEHYQLPSMMALEVLRQQQRFYFVVLDPYENQQFLRNLFPNYSVRKVSAFLYEIQSN